MSEMVKAFRSHPSVLFWSIGNESVYGTNFQLCWDWVKATDTTRPVIFSYPGSAVEKKAKIFDILSMHYQNVYGNINQWGCLPVIFRGMVYLHYMMSGLIRHVTPMPLCRPILISVNSGEIY